METRNVESVTFPSPGETWLTNKPTPSSDPTSTPSEHYPITTTGEQDASQSYPSEDILQDLTGDASKVPQDTITLPPEALLENSENGLVKMVFFSYDGLHYLLQPDDRTYTTSEANFKVRLSEEVLAGLITRWSVFVLEFYSVYYYYCFFS